MKGSQHAHILGISRQSLQHLNRLYWYHYYNDNRVCMCVRLWSEHVVVVEMLNFYVVTYWVVDDTLRDMFGVCNLSHCTRRVFQ